MIILLLTISKPSEKKSNKKSYDKGSCFIILLGVWLSVVVSSMVRKQIHWLLPNMVFWIGIIFMLLGVVIRIWAVWTLRKFFSLSVVIKSEQKLINNGLYKYLRHPAYTGSILAVLGIPLSLRSFIATPCVLIILACVYGYRIFVEEKALLKNFGNEYINYKKTTWRIIPWVW
ncbi:methyltransferase family protein [Clostridium sp. WILCCON 0269]|uniref:Methyltransferase family protein n=1 Tax=Candidatus Clostridium eludens TaxID=3381663 RepID=A0ABW8SVE0_9CLOT